MSTMHRRAVINSLRRFEETGKRHEPKKPKDRSASRRPKKGRKRK